ncbi:MAG TPA: hypothetical protein VF665_19355 [Longimicrobium sp.]|jgi:hypothetical protein|uniref:hypothetical protein n=1 Tax=Longimicrobium sp. TaxID=2029185 RepID=UPI002ED8E5E5
MDLLVAGSMLEFGSNMREALDDARVGPGAGVAPLASTLNGSRGGDHLRLPRIA